jgi:hypothetical protein
MWQDQDFNGDIALVACLAASWTAAMVRRWHADPFGFLRLWNEVPALMGMRHPPRLPGPAPAWSPSSWGSFLDGPQDRPPGIAAIAAVIFPTRLAWWKPRPTAWHASRRLA